MITGDIDLTEHLDFYRDKKPKELPSVIPWDHVGIESFSYLNSDLSLSDSTINISFRDREIRNFSQWYNTWEDDEYNIYDLDNYDNYSSWSSNHSISTTSRTSININYLSSYIEDYFDYDEYVNEVILDSYLTSSRITKYFVSYKKEKPIELPFCGKKRKHILSTVFNKKNEYKSHRLLPWFNIYDDRITRSELIQKWFKLDFDESPLPWIHKIKTKSNYPDRGCPWFNKLGNRIYDDYIDNLYEEVDYTKYLTDMSWIGVH